MNDYEFKKLSAFIYINYGINIPDAKKIILESRLQKRLKALNLTSYKKYIERILDKEENEEIVKMIDLVSTNKTDFFREKAHFDFLSNVILPEISENKCIKIWSAASSSGEEVYSIAITIQEYLEKKRKKLNYSILGTDISSEMLQKGSIGIFNKDRISHLPIALVKKYFLKSKNIHNPLIRVNLELRNKVMFLRHNLIGDNYPGASGFDIIFCRNVLIYFDRPTQQKIILKLLNKLKTGGYLFLGHSESILGMNIPLKQLAHTTYQKV